MVLRVNGRVGLVDVTWTTIHLAVAALQRGLAVRILEVGSFSVDERGTVLARASAFDKPLTPEQLVRKLREAEGHGGLVCSTPNALKSFALAFLHAHRHLPPSPSAASSVSSRPWLWTGT